MLSAQSMLMKRNALTKFRVVNTSSTQQQQQQKQQQVVTWMRGESEKKIPTLREYQDTRLTGQLQVQKKIRKKKQTKDQTNERKIDNMSCKCLNS